MLSDKDVQEITSAAKKALSNYAGHNNQLDLTYLQKAIAEAISAAIKQYDRIR